MQIGRHKRGQSLWCLPLRESRTYQIYLFMPTTLGLCMRCSFVLYRQRQLEDGAYAEFAMVKDGHLAKIPEGMSFEDTASMGAGVTTVGQALYHNLKLPWPTQPSETPFPILIYGGSTATGTLAIQYAKL